jgi:hypothetical protein
MSFFFEPTAGANAVNEDVKKSGMRMRYSQFVKLYVIL